ncbi:hypothetical protein EXIGLDRAFT_772473 [Exidia glandulosa HHB12029]|uniref:Gcn1 N-terminal domain-containing protein n=1 Tax=Exidia glandulosa HHB12029 TaxID=1314781 RepID=A0A165FAJ9_EXIGL|nr:hypothetical protein EXIGLDRAFT_772473 [Exidia glandulosa HHB12029]
MAVNARAKRAVLYATLASTPAPIPDVIPLVVSRLPQLAFTRQSPSSRVTLGNGGGYRDDAYEFQVTNAVTKFADQVVAPLSAVVKATSTTTLPSPLEAYVALAVFLGRKPREPFAKSAPSLVAVFGTALKPGFLVLDKVHTKLATAEEERVIDSLRPRKKRRVEGAWQRQDADIQKWELSCASLSRRRRHLLRPYRGHQLDSELQLVRRDVRACESEFLPYFGTLSALLLEKDSVVPAGSILVGRNGVDAFLDLTDGCTGRIGVFKHSLGVATFSALKNDGLPKDTGLVDGGLDREQDTGEEVARLADNLWDENGLDIAETFSVDLFSLLGHDNMFASTAAAAVFFRDKNHCSTNMFVVFGGQILILFHLAGSSGKRQLHSKPLLRRSLAEKDLVPSFLA